MLHDCKPRSINKRSPDGSLNAKRGSAETVNGLVFTGSSELYLLDIAGQVTSNKRFVRRCVTRQGENSGAGWRGRTMNWHRN